MAIFNSKLLVYQRVSDLDFHWDSFSAITVMDSIEFCPFTSYPPLPGNGPSVCYETYVEIHGA